MNKAQTRTRKRIADHGEVFTAEREVKAMLDLVKSESERIDSRFLEPACGNGNFLVEILRRKLATVTSRYGKHKPDWERYAVIAIMSIYGVELLADNCVECRERLFEIWDNQYKTICKKEVSEDCRNAVKYILQKNILNGDALTLKQENGKPIIFAEWSAVNGCLIKRRDFRLDEMLEGNTEQMSIFMDGWEYDEEIKAFIPLPIKEYPPIHYRRLHDNG